MTHESEELNEVRLLLQSARGHIAEMKAEGLRREAYEAPLALNDPRRARLNRLMADAMALWRQCERPACRRARRCRGLPGACVARHAAAVPAPVREGAELLLRGARIGVPYDETRRDAPEQLAAVETWVNVSDRPLPRRPHCRRRM